MQTFTREQVEKAGSFVFVTEIACDVPGPGILARVGREHDWKVADLRAFRREVGVWMVFRSTTALPGYKSEALLPPPASS